MARRQGQRYRTAGELVEACTSAVAGLPGSALDRASKRALVDDPGAARSPDASVAGDGSPPSLSRARRRERREEAASRPPEAAAEGEPPPAAARRRGSPRDAHPAPPWRAARTRTNAAPAPRAADGRRRDRGPRNARPAPPCGRRRRGRGATPIPRRRSPARGDARRRGRRRSGRAQRRTPGRPLVIAVAIAAVFAPILLGYALGAEDPAPPEPQARRAATGSITMSIPPGWTTARVDLKGLDLVDPIGVRDSADVELVSGRLRDPAPGLDPTTEALRDTIATPRRDNVRLAERTALRYAGDLAEGGSIWVMLLPDSPAGPRSDAAGPTARTSTRSAGGSPRRPGPPKRTSIPLGPDEALGETLRAALATLSEARGAAREPLRARSAAKRARAARDARRSRPPRARRPCATRTPGRTTGRSSPASAAALTAEAKALDRLASAAKRNDRAGLQAPPQRRSPGGGGHRAGAARSARRRIRRDRQAHLSALRAVRAAGRMVPARAPSNHRCTTTHASPATLVRQRHVHDRGVHRARRDIVGGRAQQHRQPRAEERRGHVGQGPQRHADEQGPRAAPRSGAASAGRPGRRGRPGRSVPRGRRRRRAGRRCPSQTAGATTATTGRRAPIARTSSGSCACAAWSRGAAGAPEGTIAILPPGYRPQRNRLFVVHTGESPQQAGRVNALPDGAVSWSSGAVGETDYTSLEGVSFDTE